MRSNSCRFFSSWRLFRETEVHSMYLPRKNSKTSISTLYLGDNSVDDIPILNQILICWKSWCCWQLLSSIGLGRLLVFKRPAGSPTIFNVSKWPKIGISSRNACHSNFFDARLMYINTCSIGNSMWYMVGNLGYVETTQYLYTIILYT